MDTRTADTGQTVAAVVGVTLGIVPLVKVLLGGDVGSLLAWLPGTSNDPGQWLVPVVVIVVAVAVVLVLERAKDR